MAKYKYNEEDGSITKDGERVLIPTEAPYRDSKDDLGESEIKDHPFMDDAIRSNKN